jgi:uncharacterized protein (TIGR00251 family)
MQANRLIFLILYAFFTMQGVYMALMIEIKVNPASGRQQIKLDKNNRLKCWLTSKPEQGKANEELVSLLADRLAIPRQKITILSGHTTRNKRIKIDLSISYDQLLSMLDIQRQTTLFELK